MPQDLKDVFDEVSQRRRSAGGDSAIAYLREQLLLTWAPDEARVLRGALAGELQSAGNYAEALQLLMHEVDAEPNEPYNSLSLAEHFHYYDINLPRALQHIGLAVTKARADGKFLYQALGVQARLSIETQNWPLLEATLQELASYEHRCGDADVFPETDFLAYIPDGVVSQEAIRRYEERVNYLRSIGYSTMYRRVG